MKFKDFKPEELLDGLKMCSDYALTKLNYEHIVSGEEDYVVVIKPHTASFSLLSYFKDSIEIIDGGVTNESKTSDSCLNINLFTKSKVISGITISLNKLPNVDKVRLNRTIIPTLHSIFPDFVDIQISSKISENKDKIEAKHTTNVYKESKPVTIECEDRVIKGLTELSEEIYAMKMITGTSAKISAENGCEIYYSNDGTEIIQYNNTITINLSFSFVNNNQSEENLTIVKYYKDNNVPENFKELLLKEVLKDISDNLFFHDLNSGTYKILLQPDASDVFFHEAFAAHLLSGTYIAENISTIFKGRQGESFPKLKGINLIMDPTIKGGFGSYVYDHQGVKSQKVKLLEDGTIKELLTDNKSAAALEIISKDRDLIEALLVIDNIELLLIEHVNEKYLLRQFPKLEDQLIYLLNKYLLSEVIEKSGVDVSLDWRSDISRLVNESNGHSRVQWWMGVNYNGEKTPIASEARMSNLVIENTNPNDGVSMEEFAIQSCINDGEDFYLSVNATDGQIDVENGTFIIDPTVIRKVYVDGRDSEIINPGSFSMSLENFLKNIERVGHKNEENHGHCGAQSGFVPVGSLTPQIFVGLTPYQSANNIEVVDDIVIDILSSKYFEE